MEDIYQALDLHPTIIAALIGVVGVVIGSLPSLISFILGWQSNSVVRHLRSLEAASLAVEINEKLAKSGLPKTKLDNVRLILEDFNNSTGMLRDRDVVGEQGNKQLVTRNQAITKSTVEPILKSFKAHMARPLYFRYLLCPKPLGMTARFTKLFFHLFRAFVLVSIFTLPFVLNDIVDEGEDRLEFLGYYMAGWSMYVGIMLLFRFFTIQNTLRKVGKISRTYYWRLRAVVDRIESEIADEPTTVATQEAKTEHAMTSS